VDLEVFYLGHVKKSKNVSADDGMCRQSDNRRRHWAGSSRVWYIASKSQQIIRAHWGWV